MSLNKTCSCTEEPLLLLQLASDGNQQALNDLFVSNSPRLHQTAFRILSNSHDAEDAVQDSMLCAFRNLHQFRGRAKFSTWLQRIAINASLMKLRKRKSRHELPLDPIFPADELVVPGIDPVSDDPDPEAQYARVEEQRIVSGALLELPRPFRTVIQLCDIEGLPTKEAAQRIGIPLSTVKARLFRARRTLKTKILRGRSTPRMFRAAVENVPSRDPEGSAGKLESIPVT